MFILLSIIIIIMITVIIITITIILTMIIVLIVIIMIILIAGRPWLRTNGVDTNGAAAKVRDFGRLGEKVRPGTFGKIKVG